MKREEFFEALSDIDESLVAAAKDNEPAAVPVMVTPKRSFVKPVCAAAACAVLTAGLITVIAINANRRPSSVIPSDTQELGYKTSVSVVNTSRYPTVVYPYTGDFSNIDIKHGCYMCDSFPHYLNESHYKKYEELAEDSSLVVMGTFTDYTCQAMNMSNSDVPDFAKAAVSSQNNEFLSFNTLKVEKVLKSDGQVWAGDEIVISQSYVIVDGAMYSLSQLTPMIKGDKWVYFLNQYHFYSEDTHGKGVYYPVNDYEGRYPVPDDENPPFKYRENTNGVVAPAVFNEGIYSELKDKLEGGSEEKRRPYEIESQKVTDIAEEFSLTRFPTGVRIEFEMGEFEKTVFGIEDGCLYVRKSNADEDEQSVIVGGPGCYVNLEATYLCDLNGDGKREICTEISFGSGIVHNFIWVLDYANDKQYALSARGKYDYFLEKRNGELEYKYRDFDMYGGYGGTEAPDDFSGDILTLDVMIEVDPDSEAATETEPETESPPKNVFEVMNIEDGNSDYLTDMPITFDMEEFPGVMFVRDPSGLHGDTVYAEDNGETRTLLEGGGGLSRIISIYLCDLNGDGNREICINAAGLSGVKYISVYDYAYAQNFILSDQVKSSTEGGAELEYVLSVTDDTLYYHKNTLIYEGDILINGGCVLSEPLTLDVMFNCTGLPAIGREPDKVIGFKADEHVELCTLDIKSGDRIYGIKAYIYDRINENGNEVTGDVAFELYENGKKINTVAPIIGYTGQRGKTYVKNKPEDYFNVIWLDGGEVLAVTYPESGGLLTAVFLTVKKGELTLMERYYTEEEQKRLELDDPHEHPVTEKTCFNTTDKFTVDGNSIVYKLSAEASCNGDTFPEGEIPLVFDFENNTVRCGKDEYAGMVYYK